jgi:hypothetical protein
MLNKGSSIYDAAKMFGKRLLSWVYGGNRPQYGGTATSHNEVTLFAM